MNHKPIPDELERIGKEIVDSAYRVHKELGSGAIYSISICIKKYPQISRITRMKGKIGEYLRNLWTIHWRPMRKFKTYCVLGCLNNYNVPLIKNGIKRFVI